MLGNKDLSKEEKARRMNNQVGIPLAKHSPGCKLFPLARHEGVLDATEDQLLKPASSCSCGQYAIFSCLLKFLQALHLSYNAERTASCTVRV